MTPTRAYAAPSSTAPLAPYSFQRRMLEPEDVHIEIQYCGVCHSDIHQCRGDWGPTQYPLVPGHEIIGTVARVGAKVTKFAVGDRVGVGCMVRSCGSCASCKEGLEQCCENGPEWTYGAPDSHSGGYTQGGYSSAIVVNQNYVLHVPATLDMAAAAPLLCAGITTYSPLRHWKVGPGTRVAIVGLGGLGHMGVKLARAMGALVTVLTTSQGKRADALNLGAHDVIVWDGKSVVSEAQFDFILDTVSADHNVNALLGLVARDGALVLVGLPSKPLSVSAFSVVTNRRSLAGSGIGGITETQEMLEFCAQHGIVSDIELIPIQKINEAWERTIKADVRYRFVIDMASLKY